MIVSDQTSSQLEDKPPESSGGHGVDNSGFGLVNWLFDHIKDRRPIFLSLFRQYDRETKIFSEYKWLGYPALFFCLIWDGVMFLIYMIAVAAIVEAITFIFVKGTGILDYLSGDTSQHTQTQTIEVHAQHVDVYPK